MPSDPDLDIQMGKLRSRIVALAGVGVIGLISPTLAAAQGSPSLEWAQRAGGTSSDEGFGVAVDAAGNAVVTGSFSGAVTFGAGAQQVTLTSAGETDIFVAKYRTDAAPIPMGGDRQTRQLPRRRQLP
jgi:hypothetical protein